MTSSANVRLFVGPFVSNLEQSIFIIIILAQIFKQSVKNKSTVSDHSESNLRALIAPKVNTVGAYKYCVLFLVELRFNLLKT